MQPILPISSRRRWRLWAAVFVAVLLFAALGFLGVAGFFDRDDLDFFHVGRSKRPLAALFVSGDMGVRFGNGPHIIHALNQQGYPVVALSSSTAFARQRSQREVETLVASAIRTTLDRTGAERLVLVGQSFGADMLQTGLAALAPELRDRVAAVVLVVPGQSVFFRADPSGLSYDGKPDSDGRSTGRTLTWAPLLCIYGLKEPDSLCPDLTAANVRRIGLPGGHFLERNYDRVNAVLLGALLPMLRAGS